MRSEVRDLWVKALESDEFIQGRGALNKQDASYCCYGVLCELAIRDGFSLQKYEDERPGGRGQMRYGLAGQTGYLPGEVIAWAGLLSDDIVVSYKGSQMSLAEINDRGVTFKNIAAMIKEQL